MVEEDVYKDTITSVMRFLLEKMEDIRTEGISENIEFKNLDGHAEDQVLENIDYILFRNFCGNIGAHLCDYTFEVGISTFEDENLFRHIEIINRLVNLLAPLKQITVYSHRDYWLKKGTLTCTEPSTVQPFGKYNTRAVQFLLVSVESTETRP